MGSGAYISGKYRYTLWREISDIPRSICFIGLNPSTADEKEDDPTIRRLISFANRWKFGQIIMVNLYAYRSTNPEALKICQNPIGPRNDRFLLDAARNANLIIACWGANAEPEREKEVVALLTPNYPLFALKRTKGDHPSHPLYLKSDSIPFLWR